MFTRAPWHVDGRTCELVEEPLPAQMVRAGAPTTRSRDLVDAPGLTIGVWEHTVGESVDVEADEVFVVLTGRATVRYDDGTVLEVGPGSVVATPAGIGSTWTVHEDLRKVYLIAS